MKNIKQDIDLLQLIQVILHNWRKILSYSAVGFIIGIIVSYSIPREYTSSIKFVSESKDQNSSTLGGLSSLMGGEISNNSDAISTSTYPDIITSTPFLSEFINIKVTHNNQNITLYDYISEETKSPWWSKITALPGKTLSLVLSIFKEKTHAFTPNIYNPKQLTEEQGLFINNLRQRITLGEPAKKTNTQIISIQMQSPEIAQQLVDSVFAKMQEYLILYKTSKVRSDIAQNIKMTAQAKEKSYALDSMLAYKIDRNTGTLSRNAQITINRLETESSIAEQIYKQQAILLATNKIKLIEQTPVATTIEPSLIPLTATSPNKPLTCIAWTFLLTFVAIAKIAYKKIIIDDENSKQIE